MDPSVCIYNLQAGGRSFSDKWELSTRRHITVDSNLDVKVASVTKIQNFMFYNKYVLYRPFFLKEHLGETIKTLCSFLMFKNF